MNVETTQAQSLISANACSPTLALMLGLVFVDRDLELIDYLKSLPQEKLPAEDTFPSAERLAEILAPAGIDLRTAAFVREKVQRFLHKRIINGNFSADLAAFNARFDLAAFIPTCRELPPGPTVFIGDSLMDIRHFSANASFPILAGSFLQSLGRGPWINAGIGGETSAQGLRRFPKDVLDHQPVRVVIAFGSNDLSNGVPLDDILANFDNMITQARQQNAQILLGLLLPIVTHRLWWCTSPLKNTRLEERRPLHHAMLDLAHRRRIPCFNLLERLTPDHFCVDGIHINQSGHELLAIETLRLLTA